MVLATDTRLTQAVPRFARRSPVREESSKRTNIIGTQLLIGPSGPVIHQMLTQIGTQSSLSVNFGNAGLTGHPRT